MMTKEERLAYMKQRFPQLKLLHQLQEEEALKTLNQSISASTKEAVENLGAFGEYQQEQYPHAILSDEK
jgi:hypothetical protein